MRKHVSLLNKRPVPVPQYSLIPKTEWRLDSRSLKHSIIMTQDWFVTEWSSADPSEKVFQWEMNCAT